MASKRPRTPARSSSGSSSSSPRQEPNLKSSRTTTSLSTRPLLCTLPPTCNPPRNQPTHIANTKDLEAHYATYHAHVCESQGCGCVFPDARLLELHQTECHDPLAAMRKDRGEKIFACHLATCPRVFSSPKTRRLHLIDTHAYPKEFFFGVTNKGVGGLLKRWGDGVSLLRKEWKERDGEDDAYDQMEEDRPDLDVEETTNRHSHHTRSPPPHSAQSAATQTPAPQASKNIDDQLDDLTSSMTSMTLVPPSIRFGRGGKSGGFGNSNETHNIDPQPANSGPNIFRGRGRGRARGFVQPSSTENHLMIPSQVLRGAAKTRGMAGSGKTAVDPNPIHAGVTRGGLAIRGAPMGRAGIINIPGRGRGRGPPRGLGRGAAV